MASNTGGREDKQRGKETAQVQELAKSYAQLTDSIFTEYDNLSRNIEALMSRTTAKTADEQMKVAKLALDITLQQETDAYKKASYTKKTELLRNKADAISMQRSLMEEELQLQESKLGTMSGREAEQQQQLINQTKERIAKANSEIDSLNQSATNMEDSGRFLTKDSRKERERKQQQQDKEAADEKWVTAMAAFDKVKNDPTVSNEEKKLRKEQLLAAQKQKLAADASIQASKALDAISDGVKNAVSEAANMVTEYKGAMDSRLQGSEHDYNSAIDKITSKLSINPFIESKKVIDEVKKASDAGIVYNLEQRAFLNTISDKIASTFDAFDSNLTRLIRLQQSDSTAARIGMETTLTKLLNSMFEDNSYMNKGGAADQVAAALVDASATMSREMAAEFEFTVQKWLGALYSLGLSDNTVTEIAKGINYLATGDVTSMASNTSLQTVFAMASSRASLDYADLFINGLNIDKTNELLGSIVAYVKEVAENSDNNVVRSAYGDIFNLSMSDMRAVSNITADEISTLSEATLNYSQMLSETQDQLSFSNLMSRSNITTMLETVYRNAMFGMGTDLANDPVAYSMYRMLEYMEKENLDMAIPFINAMGFGLDLNTSVQDIMKLALGVGGAFSLLGNIVSGITSGGGLDIDSWGAAETTHRGGSLNFSAADTGASQSGGDYVVNQSSDDAKTSSLNSATDDAESSKEVTNKNTKSEHTFDDFYTATIVGTPSDQWIRTYDYFLEKTHNSDTDFLSSRDTRMYFTGTSALSVEDARFNFIGGALSVISNNDDDKIVQALTQIKSEIMKIKEEVSKPLSLSDLLGSSGGSANSEEGMPVYIKNIEEIVDELNMTRPQSSNNSIFNQGVISI